MGKSLNGGINWFDTAELYGNGASEHALAQALRANGKRAGDVLVATKWRPMLRTAASIGATIDDRLTCLEGFGIDLYQVHLPFSFSSVEAEMDAMAALVERQKIRTVGVSNFNAGRMKRARTALERHRLPLVSNQMKYSLLDRSIESNGVLAAAKELGITIIAFSPLEQGLLTGKFHDDRSLLSRISAPRRLSARRNLERSRPLIELLKEVASSLGVTTAQVVLAWTMRFHGEAVVVIPGATSLRQAEQNVAALGVTLTADQLRRIDEASRMFL